LLKAIKKNKGESILWMNGDIVFDKNILTRLKKYIDKDISFVAVNTSKVGDEEVKYTLNDDYINKLSKEVENGLGEAVGINFISSKYVDLFIKRLEECKDNDYFEKALEMAIEKDGFKIKAVDISDFNCIEIDFEEDLKNANNLI
jgi:choline kinase